MGNSLLFLFLGVIIGIIIMACIVASGRESFEEEVYKNLEENKDD